MSEKCIMNDNPPLWRNFRFPGSERHEIFEGNGGNRKKSIEDGLVIFTTPKLHRTGKHSIHLAPKEWTFLKAMGQKHGLNTIIKLKKILEKDIIAIICNL